MTVKDLKKFIKENKVKDDAVLYVDMGHANDPTEVYAIDDYNPQNDDGLAFLIDAEIYRID